MMCVTLQLSEVICLLNTKRCIKKRSTIQMETKKNPTETLLIEDNVCALCEFKAMDDVNLEAHMKSVHGTESTLSEDVSTVKCKETAAHLYKCDECIFTTNTPESFKDHKTVHHPKSIPEQAAFLHSCITCSFKTNEFH